MRLFLTASADTTLYQRYPTTNTGLDEVIEVGKVAAPEDLGTAYTGSVKLIIVRAALPVYAIPKSSGAATLPTSSISSIPAFVVENR